MGEGDMRRMGRSSGYGGGGGESDWEEQREWRLGLRYIAARRINKKNKENKRKVIGHPAPKNVKF